MAGDKFDVIIIGGGPAGYVAAIRAAQLGMRVACVDKNKRLGGTCLNIGCIPSKALLNISEKFAEINSDHFADMGIIAPKPKLDLKAMMANKDKIVAGLTSGIELLFKKNKITLITGMAKLVDKQTVQVKQGRKNTDYKTDKILIATGSVPAQLKNISIDEDKIVSSTGALSLKQVPRHFVVIGAGAIGLEMGAVWSRLGAKTEIIEYLPRILPGMDDEIAASAKKIMEKQGIKFHTGQQVQSAKIGKSGVDLVMRDAQAGKEQSLNPDIVLVATGRVPYTEGLGLEEIGVNMTPRGQIEVDEDFETNIAGIFAIGDVIAGPMLAHKAEEDGVAAVEIMAGKAGHVDYNLVPAIVYTAPEIAAIGASEEALKEAGTAYKKGVFPMLANSRARAVEQTDGFIKILADAKTDRVLGCHIISHDAGTLIHEIAGCMAFGGAAEDIARTCHAHPTLNEAIKEAALAVEGAAIHI